MSIGIVTKKRTKRSKKGKGIIKEIVLIINYILYSSRRVVKNSFQTR
jgi:hypothetical protein